MAYQYGDRKQMTLLPNSIEKYVSKDSPVRAYDAFVEALDFRELGISLDPNRRGAPPYDPKAMLKLLVYGYSYGVSSSRKLEREIHNNLTFIWLMGGLKPDFKTISEFRRNHKPALTKVLKQCARMCVELDLVAGNVLFVDGSKIRANAARARSHDKAYYEKQLDLIDERIEKLLHKCEAVDQDEQHLGSLVSMNEELAKAEDLKARIQSVIDRFKDSDRKKLNQTDPDCAIMRSTQGSHASYNVQSVVDDKNGLIVQAEAVSDTSDNDQFSRQITQAHEVTGKACSVGCADAGYADTEDLKKIDSQGIKVIVPYHREPEKAAKDPFSKKAFTYDAENDTYVCPNGHTLKLHWVDPDSGKRHYLIKDRGHCHACEHYGICTKAKKGRKIVRLPSEEVKEKLENLFSDPETQQIYRRRKNYVEHPFGHIKRNLRTQSFLLRGRDGVQAETSVLATCFNVARMITIFGVQELIRKLRLRTVPA
jgi:transposase